MSDRPYPDEQDDSYMDELEREFIRRREAEDAERDHAQAEAAMSTPARIALGNAAIIDAVTAKLSRKQG